MINEAMFYDNEKLNPFTEEVKRLCIDNGKCLVRLRDETIKEIKFLPACNESDSTESFITDGWDYVWNLDGSSITSEDFDMIELK